MNKLFGKYFAVTQILLFSIAGFLCKSISYAQDTDLKFENITSEQGLAQNTIHGIVKDKYGFMWFGTWGGLCRYDGYTFKTYRYSPYNNKSINNNKVHNVIKDADQNIWILTVSGTELCRYNYQKDNFDRIPVGRISRSFLDRINRRNHLLNVNYSFKNYKWMMDISSVSLQRLNIKSGQIKKYTYNAANPWSLNGANVADIYMDNHNMLWVGSYSYGINKANLNGKPFEYYYHDPFTSASLVDNNVSAICEDNSGGIWVGTRDNGITVIGKNGYVHYANSPKNANTIVDNQIRFLFCDSRGKVWVATKKGLSCFNPLNGTFRQFTEMDLNNISVYAIAEDREHNILIGTWQGIYHYNPLKNKLKHFGADKLLKFPWVRTIIQDRKQQLWVGTEGGGISILKPILGKDTLVVVRHLLHEDKKNAISDNRIYCMYQDRDGLVWIGTGNGLDFYNPVNNKIMHFPLKSGLGDATIAGITQDNNGFMWISHKKGISRLGKRKFTIRNYTSQDGLQGNEFSDGAVFKSRYKNKLYFGGNNGLNAFNPDSIRTEQTLPNTVLTELQILNHKVDIDKNVNGRVVLTKPLYLTNEIELNYEDRSVAIEFAGLHYSNPLGNRYAYKLDGFDKDWVYTDASRRVATYSNLDAGNYTFRVLSSNSDGIWNPKPAILKIHVNPPLWAGIPAYIFYGLVLLLIFYTYHYYSTEFMRLKSNLSYELLIRKKENELHQNKLQFFTNISHEIKTPLTLILAPIERLAQIFSSNQLVSSQIKTMKINGDRLLRLIDQLLDFRKLETGNTALNLRNNDIVDFLSHIVSHFIPLAETKQQKLEFETPFSSLHCFYDEDKLEKVMANLLSNALKFTPPSGSIRVNLGNIGRAAVIKVINSGTFIQSEAVERIFTPFQQLPDNPLGGTGLGLAFSKGLIELHGGTISVYSSQKENGLLETSFVIELPAGINEDPVIKIEKPAALPLVTVHTELITDNSPFASVLNPETTAAAVTEKGTMLNNKIPVILFVEDNFSLRKYLVEHFEHLYKIIEAQNGLEGLQLAARDLPDLIISDVMMPEMDGFEFCKQLKSDLRIGHIPVILLTARSHEQDKIEGIETGAEDYIIKPFSLQFLAARIKNLLVTREQLKRKYRQEVSLNVPEDVTLSPDEKMLRRMLLFIEERLSNPDLSIEEICEEVGASRANLYRKVKGLTGLSIAEVIKEVRLKRAKQLLMNQKLNVNEVAFQVGFSDSNHFGKCFKTEFGISPTAYKKKYESA